MNKFSKFSFNYYLRKHGSNALSNTLKSVKQLNINNIPEFNLPQKIKYKHFDNYYKSKVFAQRFVHEVISCILNPDLQNDKEVDINQEAKELAKIYIKDIKLGAYSDSFGHLSLRRNFKNYMQEKDGITDISEKNMFFTNGSISSLEHILSVICNKNDQVLIPNPFYPLMINTITSKSIVNLEYKLKENDWSIDFDNLRKVYKANRNILPIKALIFSNPGEPTGKVYDKQTVKKLIEFCYENKICLVSWEVGRYSIHCEKLTKEFLPTIKILEEMPDKIRYGTSLFTIYGLTRRTPNMSSLRSGLCLVNNLDPFVFEQTVKYKSIDLCSSILSQVSFDIVHSQDYYKLFGKEFGDKYYGGINSVKNDIAMAKTNIIKLLRSNPNEYYSVNDIDAGINLFTKLNAIKSSIFIEKFYKKNENSPMMIFPGKQYGTNREDYLNILINTDADYSFLNI